MDNPTILMTCMGGQLGPWLLKAFKTCTTISPRVVAVDGRADAMGRTFADAFHQVPMGDHPDYADRMLEICRKEGVDVVFPGSDEEALTLAMQAQRFADEGIRVSCPSAGIAPLMRNKADMYDHLVGLGLPVPEYHRVTTPEGLRRAAEALGYPQRDFLVKPTEARGGRGVWVISSRVPTMAERNQGLAIDSLDLDTYLASMGDGEGVELMAMTMLPGAMYDVDVLANAAGDPYYLISRRRYHVRTTPFRGCWLDPHPGVLDLAGRIQGALRLPNLFDYDIILDADDNPWLLEVNPRMSGSLAVSVMHGLHLLEFAVLSLLGREVPRKEIPWGRGGKPILDMVPVEEHLGR